MTSRCVVCNSDRQAEIEVALTSGRSLRAIEGEFPGVGRMSLSRHKRDHLGTALVEVRQARQLAGAASLIDRLEGLVTRADAFLSVAEKAGNTGQGLAALREVRATLELLGRASGELSTAPVIAVNVLADPTWLLARGAMLDALAPYPEARLAAAEAVHRLEGPKAA